ncbi:MAG: metallophosphatase family protein [Lachnospiraceae bacterium]|nr:metallophosphatase family protein [Lachnospiraceae bacterium]
MIYITGDTHGSFERFENFCRENHTTKEDILIILGDAGVNYYGGVRDDIKKEYLEGLPITLFCIHGNHEQRPSTIPTYAEQEWNGGIVYVEKEYPSIIFAKDGEIYDLDGRKAIAIGGAYSIDKMLRIVYGYGWWADEQPSEEIKQYVEKQLKARDWKIDVVLSHTVPLKYEPTEVFLPGVDQSRVDKSTEEWLGKIEERLEYRKWYCGHYHTEKKVGKVRMMFETIELF